ncbi:MAG: 50S ribosomal protein L21 [bacterium]|nr:50S ribosomal protein L21 [bacterium]
MFAIIKTGGKQYRVKENDILTIEKLPGKVGESVFFEEVLLTGDEKGENVKVGAPLVAGAKVEAKILYQGLGKKVDVVKFKSKVRYRRRVGHRQEQTRVQIAGITY